MIHMHAGITAWHVLRLLKHEVSLQAWAQVVILLAEQDAWMEPLWDKHDQRVTCTGACASAMALAASSICHLICGQLE